MKVYLFINLLFTVALEIEIIIILVLTAPVTVDIKFSVFFTGKITFYFFSSCIVYHLNSTINIINFW